MKLKTALTIAGSDCSGGAGIQADMKTMTTHGVYAMSAVTALTAQNTTGVRAIQESTPDFLGQQLDAIFEDIHPDAVKIGMVSSAELISVIAQKLRQYGACHIVVDPVMVATSGARLLQETAVETLKRELLPLAEIVTPNIPEAEILANMDIRTAADMETAARLIGERYHCAVLCKGGHNLNDANDLLWKDGVGFWFQGKRIDNPNTHGTGCTLSSAIAANLAKGLDLDESVRKAKEYISGALAAMLDLGKGSGPMNHMFDGKGDQGKADHGRHSVSERLRDAAASIWEAYQRHPFVTGMGDGTLAVEKFRHFMLQDYLYLLEYARVFALGVVKERDPERMRTFAAHVEAILEGEMNLHRAYMKRLGIAEEQVLAVKPALDNLSYTNYMLSVAHAGGPMEILAAILACSWSYAEIGQALAAIPGAAEHPFYGEWIRGYTSEDYMATNRALMEWMDELAAHATGEQMEALTEIFVTCSRYELAFWDMSWEMRT